VLDLPGEGTFDLADAESPRFVGRAVVALATDPDVMTHSGKAATTSALAGRYEFTDVDGSTPEASQLRPNSPLSAPSAPGRSGRRPAVAVRALTPSP
jgi:hypothetical protein